MAGAHTLKFDNDNFESEVLKAEQPVLVDFWAEWCGPCVALAPTIDELAAEYQGRAKVGKLDVDAAHQVAARYGVMNIPTVILFHAGEPAGKIVGLRNKQEYVNLIASRLTPAPSPTGGEKQN